MKPLLLLVSLTLVTGCASAGGMHNDAGPWARLASLPDPEGFAGSLAGVSCGAFLVAGGANFPDARPWEGGTKVWYDTVFVLDHPRGEWKVAGKLPRPLGYGVSVTHAGGVVCVGGSDATRHYADAFRLEWQAGRLITTELPPLPKPVANACGALLGDVLYVVGGQETPEATGALATAYRIDLAAPEPRWHEAAPLPGGRILAIAAAAGGALWVAGGVDLAAGADGKAHRKYLNEVLRFDPRRGWERAVDLPYPVAAAPSPAPTDRAGFFVVGGDDGIHVSTAPHDHPGFNRSILHYDVRAKRWSNAGELPAARVTTPCVKWNDTWVIPTGEARPGVRSPEVWGFDPGKTE